MRRFWLGLTVLAVLAGGCATLPTSPADAFDDYMEAFAEGDAPRLWALSGTSARRDAARFRDVLKAYLEDPDPVKRTQVEGIYGKGVRDVVRMDDRAFFVWWIGTMRHRIGGPQIRRMVESWRRVAVQMVTATMATVSYREGGTKRVDRLPVEKVGDFWLVGLSPFPKATEAPKATDPDKAPEDAPSTPDP